MMKTLYQDCDGNLNFVGLLFEKGEEISGTEPCYKKEQSKPGRPFSNTVALCRLEIAVTGRADSSYPPKKPARVCADPFK